jgi:hypothetical protein
MFPSLLMSLFNVPFYIVQGINPNNTQNLTYTKVFLAPLELILPHIITSGVCSMTSQHMTKLHVTYWQGNVLTCLVIPVHRKNTKNLGCSYLPSGSVTISTPGDVHFVFHSLQNKSTELSIDWSHWWINITMKMALLPSYTYLLPVFWSQSTSLFSTIFASPKLIQITSSNYSLFLLQHMWLWMQYMLTFTSSRVWSMKFLLLLSSLLSILNLLGFFSTMR